MSEEKENCKARIFDEQEQEYICRLAICGLQPISKCPVMLCDGNIKCYYMQRQRLRGALKKLQDNLDNILLPDYNEDYGNYNDFYQSSSAIIQQALGGTCD